MITYKITYVPEEQQAIDYALEEEMQAVRQVLEAGKRYGYGNIIAHLKKAWIEYLVQKDIPEELAVRTVRSIINEIK